MNRGLVFVRDGMIVGSWAGSEEDMALQSPPQGAEAIEATVEQATGIAAFVLVDGELQPAPAAEPVDAAFDWRKERRESYPDPQAQLEAITDLLLNEDPAKLEVLRERIAAVKAAIPKP